MSTHLDRFDRNIQRVDNLCDIFEVIKDTPKRPTVKEADVLRAAVVFLHSAMEDYIRGVLTEFLPKYDSKKLENIGLYQLDNRSGKFTLGMLQKHSDMRVSELISKSVEQQMSYTSFNDTTDITAWLGRIGVSTNDSSVDLSQLNTTIKRRHKIVHEMDANQLSGRGNHSAAALNHATVKAWETNVIAFINLIEKQLPNLTVE